MAAIYRVIASDGNLVEEGTSVDEVIEIVKRAEPGRYRIDLVQSGPGPAVGSSRIWGEVIKTVRGRIKLSTPPGQIDLGDLLQSPREWADQLRMSS